MGDWLRLLRTCTIPTLLAASALAHEDDPKLWALRPPHQAKPVFTTVPAGMPMASSGTPRAMSANGIALLANLPLSTFGASSGNDCWGYTSPSGREIALFGHSNGTGFVDISDPRHPVVLLNAAGPNSLWRDIKIFSHYAYVVSEGGSGIQIFDLGNVDNGVVTLVNTVTAGGGTATHNVAIDEASGFLYRCGGGSNVGLRVYDLNANPTNPPFVGQWLNLYCHDVQVVTYTSGPYAGKQIAFACTGTGNGSGATRLSILDVTNKSSITTIKEVYWPGGAYSHQCWVSEDLQYCYLDDELDEPNVPSTTYIIDVSNLATAFLAGSCTNGNTAITHNNYVKGDLLYAANYRSGVRIFDITNRTVPQELAFYDTFPADDAAQFNGLWSVYPYFPSGVLIGSDLESGLFVWWVGATPLDISLAQGAPSLLNPGGQSLDVTVIENTPGAYVAGSAKLVYDAGAGAVIAPLASLGGSAFRADFPALPCGTNVSWYLEAESSTGLTWTYPEGGASTPLSSIVALGTSTIANNEMETAAGWVSGDTGDNATSGQWLRADPVGTAAQPEDDHSPTGVACWVTGNASPGSAIGTADVDGGTTTLLSANYNLTGLADPIISYWRWYSNTQNGVIDDTFVVQVRNGGAWVTVETVGPTGIEANGGWYYHEFHVSSFVTPSATVQVRFRASDLGSGSIVEAAIDDFQIRDVDCSAPVVYCTSGTSGAGCAATMSATGFASASSTSGFVLTATNVEGQRAGLVFYGLSGASSQPWGTGTSSFLCVKAPSQRTPAQNSGGNTGACDGTLSVDWNAFTHSGPVLGVPFQGGTTVWSQAWYRDPASSATTSLSNGLRFVVGP